MTDWNYTVSFFNLDKKAKKVYRCGERSSPFEKEREEASGMQTWKERFYARDEDAFRVLIEWTRGLGLVFSLKELDKPWTNIGSSYHFELIIELPFGNKEMLKSLFMLVDRNGFTVSTDCSAHFKEEKINDKTRKDSSGKGKIAA